ncbi:MAG TPA: HPF/RaiA family ribosome-associated protein [Bacteroidales bacterium]|nr:hypothetical protein [Bacteroidales bacterium]HNR43060.1 HPF/RaiA family ribosome-associated protein [Bacteroidales bacterium]HPM18787.1 HPF/RaiA family ribosome-associated protein [Bacteroidales bacterium]
MKFRVESQGFKMSPSLRKFAREKLGSLNSYYAEIQEIEVTLVMEVKGAREVVNCILNIRMPGRDAYVKSTASIFEDAILKAAESARRKLRKRKTQLENAKRKATPNRRVSAKKASAK